MSLIATGCGYDVKFGLGGAPKKSSHMRFHIDLWLQDWLGNFTRVSGFPGNDKRHGAFLSSANGDLGRDRHWRCEREQQQPLALTAVGKQLGLVCVKRSLSELMDFYISLGTC